MSGLVGILNFDGAPVAPDLLALLTKSLGFRGPDAQDTWLQGHVGFGHTMLRTTFEASHEHQPCTLDGQTWITADCRIDAREELIRDLTGRGRTQARSATDPELILHAYSEWGQDCVQHLLGDFSFAIWDPRNQRLFCARDQIGLKLLYYARCQNCLLFSNTINAIRLHPDVSDQLNDLAIADFLLFSCNQDLSTTSFAQIRRLPPAHTLTVTADDLRTHQYWTLPADPPLRLRRSQDYVDQCLDLLHTATRDRLRTDRVGILMSGGLDSTALAAIALRVGREQSPNVEVKAHCVVFDRLIPDRERYFAEIAAAHLNVPIAFYPGDDYEFHPEPKHTGWGAADPAFITVFGAKSGAAEMEGIAKEARVAFWGEGPDNALSYEWRAHLRYELRKGHFFALARDLASFVLAFRQLPFSGRRSAMPSPPNPAGVENIPVWLNSDLVNQYQLRERYAARIHGMPLNPGPQGARPFGYASFAEPLWQSLIELQDPGATGLTLEIRAPYLDLRVLRFLLAVPAIPWCRDKHLLRRALSNDLPAAVTARPKTGLAGFPTFQKWMESHASTFHHASISRYVDLGLLRDSTPRSHHEVGITLRAASLSYFLQTLSSTVSR